MIHKYPTNYQLLVGYANILCLSQSYEEAVFIYDKALSLKHNLVNAVISKMFICFYWRVDKKKSI